LGQIFPIIFYRVSGTKMQELNGCPANLLVIKCFMIIIAYDIIPHHPIKNTCNNFTEMGPRRKKWQQKLLRYERTCRTSRPAVNQKSLPKQGRMQCTIIAGALAKQLHNLQKLADYNRLLVFTSTEPGLVAARRILHGQSPPCCCLSPEEYRQWMQFHPDINFQFHAHLWSHFVEHPGITNCRFSISANEDYWLHTEGMVYGPKFGRGADHLWKWDGEKPVLLQRNYAQWTS
jgi:hypothetical protein